MNHLQHAFTAALSVVFALSPCQTEAQRMSVPTLPVPSGSYAIGRQAVHLIDSARADRFATDGKRRRELMVYIWYPVRRPVGQLTGDYLPGAKQMDETSSVQQVMRGEFESRWPLIVSGSIRSHVLANAPPATHPGGFPVVLFSHGLLSTSFAYSAQLEDLVSHGYVVVAIEHTDAAGAVLFPDGQIRAFRRPTSALSGDPLQQMISAMHDENEIGAEDVRFVLDTLEKRELPLVEAMDMQRIAAVGHSYGGTLTARACQLDPRIRACISEDGEVNPIGAFLDYPDHALLTQPFLLIEIDRPPPSDEELTHMRETREQWEQYLTRERQQLESCEAGSYRAVLRRPGMVHGSFSDEPVFTTAQESEKASEAIGNLLLIEEINRAFLGKYLKRQAAPLLDKHGDAPAGVTVEHFAKQTPRANTSGDPRR